MLFCSERCVRCERDQTWLLAVRASAGGASWLRPSRLPMDALLSGREYLQTTRYTVDGAYVCPSVRWLSTSPDTWSHCIFFSPVASTTVLDGALTCIHPKLELSCPHPAALPPGAPTTTAPKLHHLHGYTTPTHPPNGQSATHPKGKTPGFQALIGHIPTGRGSSPPPPPHSVPFHGRAGLGKAAVLALGRKW